MAPAAWEYEEDKGGLRAKGDQATGHGLQRNVEVANGYHALAIDEVRRDFPPCLWDEPAADGQTIEQVWFAGVHSDIGGWYDERGLSNLTLHWMLEKASSCGLRVH